MAGIDYVIIAIVVILIFLLLFFLLKRNKKDKKEFEQELLNQSDVKPERHEDEN
jgi:preprotein translocase subunit YajC